MTHMLEITAELLGLIASGDPGWEEHRTVHVAHYRRDSSPPHATASCQEKWASRET